MHDFVPFKAATITLLVIDASDNMEVVFKARANQLISQVFEAYRQRQGYKQGQGSTFKFNNNKITDSSLTLKQLGITDGSKIYFFQASSERYEGAMVF